MTQLFTLLLLCLTLSTHSKAAEYFHCTDANGNQSFSQEPCSPNAVIETTNDSYLGGEKLDPGRSALEQLENYRNSVKKIERITGKPEKVKKEKNTRPPCDNVLSLTLRNARVSKDIMKCHSMDDIRDIYGDPNSVSTWSDRSSYDTRWKYRNDKKQTTYIYFKQGQVTKWNTTR